MTWYNNTYNDSNAWVNTINTKLEKIKKLCLSPKIIAKLNIITNNFILIQRQGSLWTLPALNEHESALRFFKQHCFFV